MIAYTEDNCIHTYTADDTSCHYRFRLLENDSLTVLRFYQIKQSSSNSSTRGGTLAPIALERVQEM